MGPSYAFSGRLFDKCLSYECRFPLLAFSAAPNIDKGEINGISLNCQPCT